MATPEQTVNWDEIVKEWRNTTLTEREFCLKHAIKPHQLSYRIYKKPRQKPKTQPTNLVPITLKPSPPVPQGLELALDGRLVVRAASQLDPKWLATFLREVMAP